MTENIRHYAHGLPDSFEVGHVIVLSCGDYEQYSIYDVAKVVKAFRRDDYLNHTDELNVFRHQKDSEPRINRSYKLDASRLEKDKVIEIVNYTEIHD